MPADRTANCVPLARWTVALAAALLVGGCSVRPRYPSSVDTVRREVSPRVTPAAPAAAMPNFDEAVALASDLKYAEAEAKFRQLAVWSESAGYRDRTAECVFWIGFCEEKQGRLREARARYDETMRRFPDTSASRMAAERLRRLATAPGPSAGP